MKFTSNSKRVIDPLMHSVVMFGGKPILIIDGTYYSNGAVSNFWYWHEIDDNGNVRKEVKHGYGYFYGVNEKYKLNITYSLTLKQLEQ